MLIGPRAVNIDSVKPNSKFSRERFGSLKSMKVWLSRQGQIEPCIVDENNIIQDVIECERWYAAKELGWTTFLIVWKK